MQFKNGAKVYTADGQDVGSVDRVVLDPRTNEVSYIVVRQGVLFTEDKVIPTTAIDATNEDGVWLRKGLTKLDELPSFEETHYITPGESAGDYPAGDASPLYWYPPFGVAVPAYLVGDDSFPTVPYEGYTTQNIPEGTVGLKEGAKVISAEGKVVGNVERVYTDPDTSRATQILVAEGWLFKEKKLIPVAWIRSVTEDEITLGVAAAVLERVPEFQY